LDNKYSDYDSAAMGEECEFDPDSYYEYVGQSDQNWQDEWANFARSLKTESRFFSRSSAEHLASLFTNVDKMNTADGRPLVIDAGPLTNLTSVYRARVFQSEEKLIEGLCRPDKHLGPPPSDLALAGRMNASGISVFYGATELDVALAEVRPPVGSRVAVARFSIIRHLRLLDLTALRKVSEKGSIFDPEFAALLERITFMRTLCQRIIKPVMPTDEAFEHLPTQAIADFLATENEPVLDGIVFPSVQVAGDGLNIVLFHKASRVQDLEIPNGIEIDASSGFMTDEGWEEHYTVRESYMQDRNPEGDATAERRPNCFPSVGFQNYMNFDSRDDSLQIDIDSVQVHQVNKVQVSCTVNQVSRYRVKKGDRKY
jgi:hypothetical protein